MHNADYVVARCLSVCPLHASIVEKAKRIVELFSPSGSHTILLFPHQTVWQYSDRDPVTGASKYTCKNYTWKNRDFRPIPLQNATRYIYTYNGRPTESRISSSCFYHIRSFKQIRSSLDDGVAVSVASALVSSRLDQVNSILYGAVSKHINRL